jgi:acetyl-CoA carboxylase biotin carboxyl carrier protein
MGKDRDREKEKDSVEKTMIRDLADLLNETGLSEIEIVRDGLKIRVARQMVAAAAVPAASAPASAARPRGEAPPAAEPEESDAPDFSNHPGCVKSPMVGTAYRAPEPGAAPFVDIGTRVTQGQTLLIIEAMKTMNHIPAPRGGVVTQVLIENGQPVEYGEPLVVIE